VLGHSFAEPDFGYFEFLVKVTQKDCAFRELSALWQVREAGFDQLDEDSLLDFIQLNIAYATQHRKRALGKENIRFPKAEKLERELFGRVGVYTDGNGDAHPKDELDEKAKEAVHRRFLMEQALRTKKVIEELCQIKNVHELPLDCYSILEAADYIDGGHEPRCADAKWHVSYLNDEDKKRIEDVFRRTGCVSYELHHGIDECIKEFRPVRQ
jgi:hypothetical protein